MFLFYFTNIFIWKYFVFFFQSKKKKYCVCALTGARTMRALQCTWLNLDVSRTQFEGLAASHPPHSSAHWLGRLHSLLAPRCPFQLSCPQRSSNTPTRKHKANTCFPTSRLSQTFSSASRWQLRVGESGGFNKFWRETVRQSRFCFGYEGRVSVRPFCTMRMSRRRKNSGFFFLAVIWCLTSAISYADNAIYNTLEGKWKQHTCQSPSSFTSCAAIY